MGDTKQFVFRMMNRGATDYEVAVALKTHLRERFGCIAPDILKNGPLVRTWRERWWKEQGQGSR